MRMKVLTACILAAPLVLGAPAGAAEPEGVLLCSTKAGGFDCEKGKCNRANAGAEIRLDFGAKTMCALRGAECLQPKALRFAMIEEPSKTVVAAVSGEGATMVFRIGADNKMAMVFVVGTGRVISFEGECRKP